MPPWSATSWDEILDQSGLTREQIEEAASIYMTSNAVICHLGDGRYPASAILSSTIREITNFMLLRGNIGRVPAFARCAATPTCRATAPLVSMKKRRRALLDALEKELGVPMPRKRGHNTVEAISAMLDGTAANLHRASAATSLARHTRQPADHQGIRSNEADGQHRRPSSTIRIWCRVEVSYVLPCLGRTEIDRNSKGVSQIVTVEDSDEHGSWLRRHQHTSLAGAEARRLQSLPALPKQRLAMPSVNWTALWLRITTSSVSMIERVHSGLRAATMSACACRVVSTCATPPQNA